MTTALLQKQIQDALTKKRAAVTANSKAAMQFILDLGFDDFVSDVEKTTSPKSTPKKAAPKKAAAK